MTMKKLLGIGLALLISSAAFAADDTVILTPGVGVGMKSKDVGSGKQAMQPILSDASGNTLLTTAGADAVSNTLTGIPVYSRALYFNGTTWDRWQGAVTATLAAETTKVIGTVRVASGGIAAGALAAGAGVDGWDLTQGAIADAAVTAGATGSVSAKLRSISRDVMTTNTWASGTLGAMANYGTSPGGVLVPGVNAFVTNTNANGQATAANSSPVVLPAAQVTADPCTLGNKTNLPISQNGTSSVELIALSGSTVIYVCSLSLVAAGATTAVITRGTGTACATGNAAVIGDTTANVANGMSFAANGGLTLGNGAGTVAKGAASGALCMTLGSNVRMSGNLTYVQQ